LIIYHKTLTKSNKVGSFQNDQRHYRVSDCPLGELYLWRCICHLCPTELFTSPHLATLIPNDNSQDIACNNRSCRRWSPSNYFPSPITCHRNRRLRGLWPSNIFLFRQFHVFLEQTHFRGSVVCRSLFIIYLKYTTDSYPTRWRTPFFPVCCLKQFSWARNFPR